MIRAFFKDLLKEIYDDKINSITFDYIDQKVGNVIEQEVKDALKPAVSKIRAMDKEIDAKISSIHKSVNADVSKIKTLSNDALTSLTEKIPAEIAKFEVNLGGLEEDFNERVRGVVTNEIHKTNYNPIVGPVKDQFGDFCSEFDFMSSLKNGKDE